MAAVAEGGLSTLVTWGSSGYRAAAGDGGPLLVPVAAAPAAATPPRVLFPCDPALNSLIVLTRSDVASLDVDAVVCPNNERLSDRSGVAGDVFRRAGPDLEAECAALEDCRTGEAKVTGAFALPSRLVVHTVGPRFNIKYRGAAEHALTSCYENVLRTTREQSITSIAIPPIHSERKGYPLDMGASVAARTIRQFLSKWGPGSLRVIVLAMQTNEQLEAYADKLRESFPRSDAEAAAAAAAAAAETGAAVPSPPPAVPTPGTSDGGTQAPAAAPAPSALELPANGGRSASQGRLGWSVAPACGETLSPTGTFMQVEPDPDATRGKGPGSGAARWSRATGRGLLAR